MYGKRITGRIVLNLAGGPEIKNFRFPVTGVNRTTSGSGIASLAYGFRATTVRLVYSHGVGSGGGFLSGSNKDQGIANFNQPPRRLWTNNLSFGVSRESHLVAVKSV